MSPMMDRYMCSLPTLVAYQKRPRLCFSFCYPACVKTKMTRPYVMIMVMASGGIKLPQSLCVECAYTYMLHEYLSLVPQWSSQ